MADDDQIYIITETPYTSKRTQIYVYENNENFNDAYKRCSDVNRRAEEKIELFENIYQSSNALIRIERLYEKFFARVH